MSEISFSVGTADVVREHLHPSAHEMRERLTVDTATDQDDIVLARHEDSVVGYLASRGNPIGDTVVWEHVVAPQFRCRGIGRRLLLEVARRTPPMARLTIDPTGDFAIDAVAAYYARVGFPGVSADGFQVSAVAHEVVDAIGEQLEEHATLKAIMRRSPTGVITISPSAAISEALALMNDNRIGSVVVSSDGETIDGLLAERDIVVGAHSSGAAMLDAPVSDYMTTDVVTADASDIVAHVMELVTIKRLRHVPLTEAGKLIGLVSVGDLLMFRMREHDMRRDRLPYRDI